MVEVVNRSGRVLHDRECIEYQQKVRETKRQGNKKELSALSDWLLPLCSQGWLVKTAFSPARL
jgi:hypothetical protein